MDSKNMEKGDFVKVKKGVNEPDYQKFDISGWKGTIVDIYTLENEKDRIVAIDWDLETIKNLPIEFIKISILDGCSFSEMHLGESDILIVERLEEDNIKKREDLILELERKYEFAGFDEQEKRISKILVNADIYVNEKNLKKYRKFLVSNLENPIYLDGVEDFPWEERFVFGYGNKKEYARLRKTRPSYKDTFKLIKILEAEECETDLFAKVKRKEDGKVFEIMLSQLKCIDENSKNYELLNDFSVWIVNY
jgi:hypothetical protein